MDAVSYAHSAKQAQRIEKFIKNPDSTSGIVTVPKVIGAGENVTIPAGRVAVLPNVQVDGTLNIEGEVFIPSGATFSKVVETEGNQTIDGVKTFSSSPIVPTPTTGTQAVNKDYVDTGAGAAFVANDTRVKTALNASGNAPIYACRAWVSFNSEGTVAIRASGNVSSITDNATGDYTVNFTTAMPDAKYSVSFGASSYSSIARNFVYGFHNNETYPLTLNSFRTLLRGSDGTNVDMLYVNVSIFR